MTSTSTRIHRDRVMNDDMRIARRDTLTYLAIRLMTNRLIHGVQVFGSFARGTDKYLSDYDVILVVDEKIANTWLDEVTRHNAERWVCDPFTSDPYHGHRYLRLELAQRLLGLPLNVDHEIDAFLFPPNWQNEDQLIRLQEAGKHHDRKFMANIAHDAIAFNPATESFPWPN